MSTSDTPATTQHLGIAGRIAHAFINSKLTPLFIAASVLLGVGAVALLPREEEPQIVVPMIDVFVQMPGASAKEVEERLAKPMEKLLWEVPGVEYIYTTSQPGGLSAIVRFYVGQDEEKSIVRLNQKLYANYDLIPPGASQPLVKPRSIDDVPVLALTLSSPRYDHFTLRRIAAQLHDAIKAIPDVSEAKLIGGQRRQFRVVLDPARMAARGVAPEPTLRLLTLANTRSNAGAFASNNREFLVEAGDLLSDADSLGSVVVGVYSERPVYLRDVADVVDGPEEPADYVFLSPGPAAKLSRVVGGPAADTSPVAAPEAAVTITVAKRKGSNAIVVADAVIAKTKELQGIVVPSDVRVTITRNYGATAEEKSNELLYHMALAILSVALLISFFLGLREALIVGIAIPVTLALTLVVFYFFGYTLNRVTLFALIFSIGILVDDAIVVLENIVRHRHLPENADRALVDIAVEATSEVGNPTLLATAAVIGAVLPMAFVRGLMGPYMEPIPVGASAAMLFSVFVSFMVTPWAAVRLLHRTVKPHRSYRHLLAWGPFKRLAAAKPHEAVSTHDKESWMDRLYRRIMRPLIVRPVYRYGFLLSVTFLLLIVCMLVPLKRVMVKMLPFDNKSEFQVIIDTPEGTTLEQTAAVARDIAEYVRTVSEVTDIETYVGTASPYNFNGLVRHYFLRRGSNVADLQINLTPRDERSRQSHDIAKAARPAIQAIAERYHARVKVAEVPPGPPVLQTLVAEVYGPDYARQIELARQIRDIFDKTPGVVDVDWYVEDDQAKYSFKVDQEKAALNGVTVAQVQTTLQVALDGMTAGLAHLPKEKEDVPIVLRVARAQRSSIEDLKAIKVQGQQGNVVSLGELVHIEEVMQDKSIYHKNLMPVVYVTGDVAGMAESPVYAMLNLMPSVGAIKLPEGYAFEQYSTAQPPTMEKFAMKWDGEWYITYEVFRDLGLAFAVVLILIFMLVVGWFQSLKTPFVILAAVPFSLIGILPAHWAMGAFFTATSMIGFIAGAGIVVRNSIILVDFIELRLAQGMPLAEAVIDAGAVRFRPMLLTAAAVVVGASVILSDPIFQGLALSLMAGEIASLLLSRMAVPILYYISRNME